ncbi:protein BREAST CANCER SUSCEPTIBILITY 2 homolog B-like isoform X1 [Tripterygium wilfordii]|uniref:protein BREAST CANCER SUSCEPTIBILITY 2 homolog B-like isoform X1 n=1 Tax=Tripterygium wilfordii TaxID=458696 RepID=UPI0018F831F8|nr:protein BREAST CANCER SUSCEPTIBILITY 2 homolog B-like isoform X1 [Tripterygium wilfordii]
MSTWQIFSDAGKNYRWEPTGRVVPSKPQDDQNGAQVQPHDSSCRFPSMVDLLLQGCSKLLEDADEGNAGNSPIFRSGLGKSVVLKQSSIAKALSVLRDDDNDFGAINKGAEDAGENLCDLPNSLFHTGSGRTVNISSAGLFRAKKLLGLEEGDLQDKYEGFEHVRTPSINNKPYGWQNFLHLETSKDTNTIWIDSKSVSGASLNSTAGFMRRLSENEFDVNFMQSNTNDKSTKPPPIKFQTAGGRSLSVSNDALQRARSLLGDLEVGILSNEGDPNDPSLLFNERKTFDGTSSNKENEFCTPFNLLGTARGKHIPGVFTSPLRSSSKQGRSLVDSRNVISRSNLIKKFDEADHSFCELDSNASTVQQPLSNTNCAPNTPINDSRESCNGSKINQGGSLSGRPLVDISNRIDTAHTRSEKKRFGNRSSISPFKRPRSSKFCTPLKKDALYVSNGLSTLSSENSCRKRVVSTKYPFQAPRKSIKEYLGVPQLNQSMLEHLPEKVRWIKANNSSEYLFFDESGINCIGAEAFLHMLAQAGASMQHVSKEWVANHYKWIVWKLACYERYCPDNSAVKFLSVSNVLEELKYRYEREVNYGHRSAIKRILDGDALPSSMMVLCISAIYANNEHTIEAHPMALNVAENINVAKVELTDGWYSVDALLDVPLSKQLAFRKLSVGQKLRLWGAGLCGWAGPVSPLEASKTANLSLHINGTYRAHWAARLGFCKCVAAPLAFRCIKSNGGPVPCTLVGVTRIYPVLFKEKLSNGGSIVRSENMETKMVQLNNQRRSTVVEGILSEFQRETQSSHINNNSDGEEGARIFKMLEAAAEPELLMAEMSSEKLSLLASYQAKLEVTRQSDLEKSIKKALEDAGLGEREVTPFVRVRVVGVTSRTYQGKSSPKEGLITIWNPTEKQLKDLVEGQAYVIAGLAPVHSESDVLYLQGRGSTTTWQLLSALGSQQFEPFFNPRKSVLLSNLGEVPFSSEFDIAALIVHVGEVYMTANQKKQWVFVTDASISEILSEEILNSLLAICFCSPYVEEDSVAPINSNLVGTTVGFYNLIKRAKDQRNNLWVAEATENSTYSFNFETPIHSHLKIAAASAQKWAKISHFIINKLKEKVISIIGDGNG